MSRDGIVTNALDTEQVPGLTRPGEARPGEARPRAPRSDMPRSGETRSGETRSETPSLKPLPEIVLPQCPGSIAPIRGDLSHAEIDSIDQVDEPASPTPGAARLVPCWVALHFPALPLMVCNFPEGLPGIVIHESGGRQLVHAACPLAQDLGVMPGMSLNAAHVLCRNLVVRPRDPQAEYRWLRQAAGALKRFTPQ